MMRKDSSTAGDGVVLVPDLAGVELVAVGRRAVEGGVLADGGGGR